MNKYEEPRVCARCKKAFTPKKIYGEPCPDYQPNMETLVRISLEQIRGE